MFTKLSQEASKIEHVLADNQEMFLTVILKILATVRLLYLKKIPDFKIILKKWKERIAFPQKNSIM